MFKRTQILLDLDGVCADFYGQAFWLMQKHTGRFDLCHADAGGDSSLEKTFGIDKQTFWEVIEAEAGFWLNLEPFPWARDMVTWLSRYGDVTIASSPSRDPRCHSQKIEWVVRHLGMCPDDVMLGGKKHLMANENHVLLDDFPKNVVKFREHGGQAVLMPSSWNLVPATRDMVFMELDAKPPGREI